MLGDDPCQRVAGAAGSERNDDSDRMRRPLVGARLHRKQWHSQAGAKNEQGGHQVSEREPLHSITSSTGRSYIARPVSKPTIISKSPGQEPIATAAACDLRLSISGAGHERSK